MKTTSAWSMKKYQCISCDHISLIGSNHYGEIYPKCIKCGWKNPMEMGQVHKCLEPVPSDMGVPEHWKLVKLGDVCDIV
jgi:hypothetical protein